MILSNNVQVVFRLCKINGGSLLSGSRSISCTGWSDEVTVTTTKSSTSTGQLESLVPATTKERLICPGWKTFVVPVFQPETSGRDKRGCSFVPGLATGTKSTLLFVPVGNTGTKGAASATCLVHPFVPVGVTNRTKGPFFFLFLFSQFFFYFNYTFAFQLNLCIGIQCVRSPLIYTYI